MTDSRKGDRRFYKAGIRKRVRAARIKDS